MDAIFIVFYLLFAQLPVSWALTLAFTLIPGLIIGWTLYRKGYGLWATVLAAELLMLVFLVVYNFTVSPVLWDMRPPSSTWAVTLNRVIFFLMVVHVSRLIPTFFAVRLGFFLARRRAEKNFEK